jgi:hypothetical protein
MLFEYLAIFHSNCVREIVDGIEKWVHIRIEKGKNYLWIYGVI